VFMRVPEVFKDFVHHPVHQSDVIFLSRLILSPISQTKKTG
jgi:hypothetical protein